MCNIAHSLNEEWIGAVWVCFTAPVLRAGAEHGESSLQMGGSFRICNWNNYLGYETVEEELMLCVHLALVGVWEIWVSHGSCACMQLPSAVRGPELVALYLRSTKNTASKKDSGVHCATAPKLRSWLALCRGGGQGLVRLVRHSHPPVCTWSRPKCFFPPYILGAHAGAQALAWDGFQQEQRAPAQLYAESSLLLLFVLWVQMSKNDTWTGRWGVSLLLA